MNKINYIYFFLFLISVVIISCEDEKSSTEPDIEIDETLIGTWDLTKITTSLAGQTVVLTPAQAGISNVAIFKSDGTFSSTSTDSDGTTEDTGTWTTAGGILTISITGDDPQVSPYTIEGNTVSIVSTVPIGGTDVPATLEFTKR